MQPSQFLTLDIAGGAPNDYQQITIEYQRDEGGTRLVSKSTFHGVQFTRTVSVVGKRFRYEDLKITVHVAAGTCDINQHVLLERAIQEMIELDEHFVSRTIRVDEHNVRLVSGSDPKYERKLFRWDVTMLD